MEAGYRSGPDRIWKHGLDARPANDAADVLASLGLLPGRIGIALDAHGLTHGDGRRLGRTSLVTKDGRETLNGADLDLVIR
jgi:hypothetical protein